jgi:predicted TPR repeat methyltransferase
MSDEFNMSVPSLNEALSLMSQGAYPAARAICQQHLAHRPDDFNARHLLGLIHFKGGNLIAATRELSRACQLDPAPRFKAQALNNLALVLQARDKREDAAAACRNALQLQPQEIAFHLNLLGLLEQLKRWPDIVEHMQSCPVLADQEDARLCHAVAARQLGQYQTALDILASLHSSIDAESERVLNLCLQNNSQVVIADWQATGAPVANLIRLADYVAEEGFAAAATPLYQAAAKAAPDNLSVRHMLDAAQRHCTAEAPSDYVRNLYDTHAEQFESRLQGRLNYNAPQRLITRLAAILDPEAPIQAADLGCGTGLCGIELHRQLTLTRLDGCDLSMQMLQRAADKEVYTSLSCTALLDFIPTLQPLELITATDVLIYTGNLQPVIQAVHGALKPGGCFAFTVEHNEEDEPVSLHTSGRYRHSKGHIETLAERYGFRVQLLECFPLRLENEVSIEGLMVILQRD